MSIEIEGVGFTDRGMVRERNEDAFLVENDLNLYVVADGMGGAAAGEIASRIFVSSAEEVFLMGVRQGKSPKDLVETVFQHAQLRILEHVKEFPEHEGMGCTGEVLTFDSGYFYLGHVGDSRTYIWRNNELRLLTVDHSLVQKHIDEGLITKEEGEHYRFRNVLYRAVGQEEELEVDLVSEALSDGDVFLLCSDGLLKEVPEHEIPQYLNQDVGLDEICKNLVNLARNRGGRDNITVVLCKVNFRRKDKKSIWKRLIHG